MILCSHCLTARAIPLLWPAISLLWLPMNVQHNHRHLTDTLRARHWRKHAHHTHVSMRRTCACVDRVRLARRWCTFESSHFCEMFIITLELHFKLFTFQPSATCLWHVHAYILYNLDTYIYINILCIYIYF